MFDQMQDPGVMEQKFAEMRDPQKLREAAIRAASQFGPPPALPDENGMGAQIDPAVHQPGGAPQQAMPQAPAPQQAPPPIPVQPVQAPIQGNQAVSNAEQNYMNYIGG
jgi:hypothetical protein